jgi:hypothetical protein
MARKIDESLVYQLKVTLQYFRPPIWRRIQVRGSTTLADLHHILQIVMGWEDEHLHQFIVDGVYYGESIPEWGVEKEDELITRLDQIVAAEKDRFGYQYDFGDSWHHQIVVEKILPPEADVHYPRCLKGKRACPPEDVGGVWGYAEFLEAIADPSHPQHDDWNDWIDEPFDPEAFDSEAVNQALRQGYGI